jgi:hypothetical protein
MVKATHFTEIIHKKRSVFIWVAKTGERGSPVKPSFSARRWIGLNSRESDPGIKIFLVLLCLRHRAHRGNSAQTTTCKFFSIQSGFKRACPLKGDLPGVFLKTLQLHLTRSYSSGDFQVMSMITSAV